MNMFGVMMVACGDADGMVSGAMHTTAATIRPAMQVRARGGGAPVVRRSGVSAASIPMGRSDGKAYDGARLTHPSLALRRRRQVLRAGANAVVSSVFFMCLPDKVGAWRGVSRVCARVGNGPARPSGRHLGGESCAALLVGAHAHRVSLACMRPAAPTALLM